MKTQKLKADHHNWQVHVELSQNLFASYVKARNEFYATLLSTPSNINTIKTLSTVARNSGIHFMQKCTHHTETLNEQLDEIETDGQNEINELCLVHMN